MEWGCMQALIDFDGWRKWKDFSQLNGHGFLGVSLFGFSETKTSSIPIASTSVHDSAFFAHQTHQKLHATKDSCDHPLNQMAPNLTDRPIQKKWVAKQLRHAASLKTLAGVQRFHKTVLEMLKDETDTKSRSVRQYLAKPIYSKITFAHKFSSS
jgi:hypothetical protein